MFCSDELEIDQSWNCMANLVSIYVPCVIQKIVYKLNKHTKKKLIVQKVLYIKAFKHIINRKNKIY